MSSDYQLRVGFRPRFPSPLRRRSAGYRFAHSAATAMLGLGPIGTLKGIKPTGGDAKKPGLGKKPATSTLDFEFSDDDEPGAPCPNARALQPQHRTHRLG